MSAPPVVRLVHRRSCPAPREHRGSPGLRRQWGLQQFAGTTFNAVASASIRIRLSQGARPVRSWTGCPPMSLPGRRAPASSLAAEQAQLLHPLPMCGAAMLCHVRARLSDLPTLARPHAGGGRSSLRHRQRSDLVVVLGCRPVVPEPHDTTRAGRRPRPRRLVAGRHDRAANPSGLEHWLRGQFRPGNHCS